MMMMIIIIIIIIIVSQRYTFEVAPVFSLIETEIVRKVCELCGYGQGDGIFSPGGSISNM